MKHSETSRRFGSFPLLPLSTAHARATTKIKAERQRGGEERHTYEGALKLWAPSEQREERGERGTKGPPHTHTLTHTHTHPHTHTHTHTHTVPTTAVVVHRQLLLLILRLLALLHLLVHLIRPSHRIASAIGH